MLKYGNLVKMQKYFYEKNEELLSSSVNKTFEEMCKKQF